MRQRKTSSHQRRGFRKGDRVRLKQWKHLSWGDRTPQEYGFVIRTDGAYIYVRPRWRPASEAFEFYDGEIELANH
jgi:hypothetical protein